MGEEPRDVEARIEDTRDRMGETVEALSAKADVPGRVKGYASQKKDALTSTVSGAAAAGSGATDEAKARARRGAALAQENPIGLAVGSVAVGFLVGMLPPASSVENDRIGPKADQLKDEVREVAGEVTRDAADRVRA